MADATFQNESRFGCTNCSNLRSRRNPAAGFSTKLGMGRGSDQKPDRLNFASLSGRRPYDAETGGEVNFKPRPIEGAPSVSPSTKPQSLLLDGQQRMTSLYQVTLRGKVVETMTPKKQADRALVLYRHS